MCTSRTKRENAFGVSTHGEYYTVVVREEDNVGKGGVRHDTGELVQLTVENEPEHVEVGPVPAMGPIEVLWPRPWFVM